MTSNGPGPLRVALAAVPPLLAESLRSLLHDRAEVTLVVDRTDEHFDVAIRTDDAPAVPADVVILLDSRRTTRGGGTIHGAHGDPIVRLDDLDELLEFVRRVGSRR